MALLAGYSRNVTLLSVAIAPLCKIEKGAG